jgi:phosphohistidine phosphatase
MRLLLIRHARAASNEDGPDAERSLTAEGCQQFRRVAQAIVDEGGAPRVIHHSPARRTTETARILAEISGLPPSALRSASWLAVGTTTEAVCDQLLDLTSEVTALVGHEPIMSALASQFLGTARRGFLPGTAACLEFEGRPAWGQGRLLWLLEPE